MKYLKEIFELNTEIAETLHQCFGGDIWRLG